VTALAEYIVESALRTCQTTSAILQAKAFKELRASLEDETSALANSVDGPTSTKLRLSRDALSVHAEMMTTDPQQWKREGVATIAIVLVLPTGGCTDRTVFIGELLSMVKSVSTNVAAPQIEQLVSKHGETIAKVQAEVDDVKQVAASNVELARSNVELGAELVVKTEKMAGRPRSSATPVRRRARGASTRCSRACVAVAHASAWTSRRNILDCARTSRGAFAPTASCRPRDRALGPSIEPRPRIWTRTGDGG
jgi:hypothetical protein